MNNKIISAIGLVGLVALVGLVGLCLLIKFLNNWSLIR